MAIGRSVLTGGPLLQQKRSCARAGSWFLPVQQLRSQQPVSLHFLEPVEAGGDGEDEVGQAAGDQRAYGDAFEEEDAGHGADDEGGDDVGLVLRRVSPPPPATAARTPAMTAMMPMGDLKESIIVCSVTVPLAIGTRMAAVRMMMPQLSPACRGSAAGRSGRAV